MVVSGISYLFTGLFVAIFAVLACWGVGSLIVREKHTLGKIVIGAFLLGCAGICILIGYLATKIVPF